MPQMLMQSRQRMIAAPPMMFGRRPMLPNGRMMFAQTETVEDSSSAADLLSQLDDETITGYDDALIY